MGLELPAGEEEKPEIKSVTYITLSLLSFAFEALFLKKVWETSFQQYNYVGTHMPPSSTWILWALTRIEWVRVVNGGSQCGPPQSLNFPKTLRCGTGQLYGIY